MMLATPQTSGITIRLRRRFAAPRENVIRAWTEVEALKRWWCPEGWSAAEIEVDLRVGGAYRIGMRKGQSAAPIYAWGHFLEVRLPERLVYTWQWQNAFEQMPPTRVTVEFSENDGATDLLLIHENLPHVEICLRHRAGWIAAFTRLERLSALFSGR